MLARSLKHLRSLSSLKKFQLGDQIFKFSTPLIYTVPITYKFSSNQSINTNSSQDIPDSVRQLILKFGEKHPSVVNAYQDLMSNSASQNKFSEAVKFGNKAFELMTQIEKPGSINQISLLNNLACIKKLNGQIQECLDDFKKAIELGKKNPTQEIKEQLLIVRSSLSSVLQELTLHYEAFKEARTCHEEALKLFGNEHPALVGIKFSLAKSLLHLRMPRDSLKYLEEALLLAEKTGQSQSLMNANIEISIAEILLRQGKGQEAEQHIQSAERICKKINDQGELAIKVQSSFGHLYSLSDHSKSLQHFENATNLAEKFYGRSHPSLAMIYFNFAEANKSVGKYDDAIGNHEKSFEIVKKFYGIDNPRAFNYHASIGLVFHEMGDPWKGVVHLERARIIKAKEVGEDHLDVALVDLDLGLCHFDCKDYDKALTCFNRMLPIFEKTFPPHHHNVVSALRHIGTTYNRLGNHDKALEYLKRSLDQSRKEHGNKDPNVPDCLNNMGLIKAKLKRFDEAISDLEEAQKIRRDLFGENEEVAQSYVNIAGVKIVKEEFDAAHELYGKAEHIYAKKYGVNHFFIGNILNNRGRIYYKQGDTKKALLCFERAQEIYHKNLGGDHPDFQAITNVIQEIKRNAV